MSLITFLRVLIFIVIAPVICGLCAAMQDEKVCRGRFVVKSYVYGFLVMFATFEAVCVPFVVRRQKFSEFTAVFDIVILAVALLSLGMAVWYKVRMQKKRLPMVKEEGAVCEKDGTGESVTGKKSSKERAITLGLWVLVAVVIVAQMIFLYFFNHLDGDDSYYVAESVITQFFDTMFQRDAYTGMPVGLDERHALATMPVFVTWLAQMCGVHPAAMAHSILAPVLLLLMYLIYILIGQALLKEHKVYVPVFVLLINIWYIWSNVSIYTAETFMYTRTWQGKAVFANIVVPLVIYFLYRALQEGTRLCWVMLFLLSVCGVFTTTASVYLLPMLYGSAAIWKLIFEKKWRPCLNLALCCVPSLLYGGIYYYLLSLWRYV